MIEQTCENCASFHLGQCLYLPPPAVQQIYAMLQAEPATQIDWAGTADVGFSVAADYGCGAWTPATGRTDTTKQQKEG